MNDTSRLMQPDTPAPSASVELPQDRVARPPRRSYSLSALALWVVIAAALAAAMATRVRYVGRLFAGGIQSDDLLRAAGEIGLGALVGSVLGVFVTLVVSQDYRGGFVRRIGELMGGWAVGAFVGSFLAWPPESAIAILLGSAMVLAVGLVLFLMRRPQRKPPLRDPD